MCSKFTGFFTLCWRNVFCQLGHVSSPTFQWKSSHENTMRWTARFEIESKFEKYFSCYTVVFSTFSLPVTERLKHRLLPIPHPPPPIPHHRAEALLVNGSGNAAGHWVYSLVGQCSRKSSSRVTRDPCVEIFNIGTWSFLAINSVCRHLAVSLTLKKCWCLICALMLFSEGS